MVDHSVFCISQDHLGTGTRDLDHPILAGAKNTDRGHGEISSKS
jgi:hypothetical protein